MSSGSSARQHPCCSKELIELMTNMATFECVTYTVIGREDVFRRVWGSFLSVKEEISVEICTGIWYNGLLDFVTGVIKTLLYLFFYVVFCVLLLICSMLFTVVSF